LAGCGVAVAVTFEEATAANATPAVKAIAQAVDRTLRMD
jgi:hypothetical protein